MDLSARIFMSVWSKAASRSADSAAVAASSLRRCCAARGRIGERADQVDGAGGRRHDFVPLRRFAGGHRPDLAASRRRAAPRRDETFGPADAERTRPRSRPLPPSATRSPRPVPLPAAGVSALRAPAHRLAPAPARSSAAAPGRRPSTPSSARRRSQRGADGRGTLAPGNRGPGRSARVGAPQPSSLANASSSSPRVALRMVSLRTRPTNAGWPVRISQRIAPRPKTSARSSTASISPRACSGAM